MVKRDGTSFKSKRISPGSLLLGVVSSIGDQELSIALPGQTRAVVPYAEASDVLFERVTACAEGEPDAETLLRLGIPADSLEPILPPLASLFSVGQHVLAVVVELRERASKPTAVKGKPVRSVPIPVCSLRPSVSARQTYGRLSGAGAAGLTSLATATAAAPVLPGQTLFGEVKSHEENGAMVSYGAMSPAFLPVPAGTATPPLGSLSFFAVHTVTSSGVTLLSDRAAAADAVTLEDPVRSVHFDLTKLMPGALIKATVAKSAKDGALVRLFDATGDAAAADDEATTGLSAALPTAWCPAMTPPPAGKRLLVRVAFVDIPTRTIFVSALFHHLRLVPVAFPAGICVGARFQSEAEDSTSSPSAVVVRAVPSVGVWVRLTRLEQTDAEMSGEEDEALIVPRDIIAHISLDRLADKPVKTLSPDLHSPGCRIAVRATFLNLWERTVSCTASPAVLADPVVGLADPALRAGLRISAEVVRVVDTGLIVSLAPGLSAIVPQVHVSEVAGTAAARVALTKRYKVGQKVKGAVLAVDRDRRHVSVTLKRTLVSSEYPIWTDFGSIPHLGSSHGFVAKLLAQKAGTGAIIRFYGDVRGYMPPAQVERAAKEAGLSVEAFCSPEGPLAPGKVVLCRAMAVNAIQVPPLLILGVSDGSHREAAFDNPTFSRSIQALPTPSQAASEVTLIGVKRPHVEAVADAHGAKAAKAADGSRIEQASANSNQVLLEAIQALSTPSPMPVVPVAVGDVVKARVLGAAHFGGLPTVPTVPTDRVSVRLLLGEADVPLPEGWAHADEHATNKKLMHYVAIAGVCATPARYTAVCHFAHVSARPSSAPLDEHEFNELVDAVVIAVDAATSRIEVSLRPQDVEAGHVVDTMPEADAATPEAEEESSEQEQNSSASEESEESSEDEGPEFENALAPPTTPSSLVRGGTYVGYVQNVANAGVFLELSPAVTVRVRLAEVGDRFVPFEQVKAALRPATPSLVRIVALPDLAGRAAEGTMRPALVQSAHALRFLDELRPGQLLRGTITRVRAPGVFVELGRVFPAALVGLARPRDALDVVPDEGDAKKTAAATVAALGERYSEGDRVVAVVLSVSPAEKKVGLGLRPDLVRVADMALDELSEESELDSTGEASAEESSSEEESSSVAELAAADAFATALDAVEGLNWAGMSQQEETESDGEPSSVEEGVEKLSAAAVAAAERARLAAEQAGELPTSEEGFERAIMANPASSYVWVAYAAFFLDHADPVKCRSTLRRALESLPLAEQVERANVWLALLNLEVKFGENGAKGIVAAWKEACQSCDTVKLAEAFAPNLVEAGLRDLAVSITQTLIRRNKQSLALWQLLLQLLTSADSWDKAEAELERAAALLPVKDALVLQFSFARMLFAAGRADEARDRLNRTMESRVKRMDLWSQYIDLELSHGSTDDVRALFERLIRLPLSARQMKAIFVRYVAFEKANKDEVALAHVHAAARRYVQGQSA
jgi:ribosomal protein S1